MGLPPVAARQTLRPSVAPWWRSDATLVRSSCRAMSSERNGGQPVPTSFQLDSTVVGASGVRELLDVRREPGMDRRRLVLAASSAAGLSGASVLTPGSVL